MESTDVYVVALLTFGVAGVVQGATGVADAGPTVGSVLVLVGGLGVTASALLGWYRGGSDPDVPDALVYLAAVGALVFLVGVLVGVLA